MFHVGAFLLPLDGGVRNKFTCYILQEEHFSREHTKPHHLTVHSPAYVFQPSG